MWAMLTDGGFLSALATIVGPLAFFAAPTEEIERLLLSEANEEIVIQASPDNQPTMTDNDVTGVPEAA